MASTLFVGPSPQPVTIPSQAKTGLERATSQFSIGINDFSSQSTVSPQTWHIKQCRRLFIRLSLTCAGVFSAF